MPFLAPLVLNALIGTASAGVEVTDAGSCFSKSSIERELQVVLERHAGGNEVDLLVSVSATPTETGTTARLRAVTGDGEVVLERSFELGAEDCPNAAPLFAAVLDRFLQELPLERWTLTAPVEVVDLDEPEPEPRVVMEVRLGGGFEAAISPAAGNVSLTLLTAATTPHRTVFGGAIFRATTPRTLAEGGVFVENNMLTVGVGAVVSRWQLSVAPRVGVMIARGVGFEADATAWLPWAELAGSAGFDLGFGRFTAEIAVSPFHHSAVTANGGASTPIAWNTFGVGLEIPLWRAEM